MEHVYSDATIHTNACVLETNITHNICCIQYILLGTNIHIHAYNTFGINSMGCIPSAY